MEGEGGEKERGRGEAGRGEAGRKEVGVVKRVCVNGCGSVCWFSGRGRILAQCDAKFTAARATFGGNVAGKKPGHVQRAIECLCLGGAATDTAAERTRVGVGWEARVRKVDAFAAIALIEGEGGGDRARSAGEMKIEPTVALFTMLCETKMAGVAWEGLDGGRVESRAMRSVRTNVGGGRVHSGSPWDVAKYRRGRACTRDM